ncbi:MAG: hypothetical protein HY471_02010 [Candidatus Sungbacteria bacterium]|nr:hypothetical protein [Candidatus Sungbacteria bacterium]
MADGLLQKEEHKVQVGGFVADFLFTVGLVVMIGAVLASLGAFVYGRMASSNAEVLKEEVKKLEVDLEPKLLDQILALDQKLRSIREVLESHVVSSNIFYFLEKNTLPQVRFLIFTYSADQRRLELTGQAASYGTLAEQVRILEALDEVETVDFGGLSINEKGILNFKMTVIVSPSLTKYQ